MTTAEYLRTPETVLPRELVYGALRTADAPRIAHQRVVRNLVLALVPFVERHRLGEVLFAPMDVVLDAAAGLVVQPDILVVSEARQEIVQDRVYGAPDLVIEVLSPHPRIGRLDERVGWFARYGVRECWLFDQQAQQVAVLTLHEGGVRGRALAGRHDRIPSTLLEGIPLTPSGAIGW